MLGQVILEKSFRLGYELQELLFSIPICSYCHSSVYQSVYSYICLSVCPFIHTSVCQPVYSYNCLSVCPFIHLDVSLPIHTTDCQSVYSYNCLSFGIIVICLSVHPGKPNERGRLSTVDLLELTIFDELLLLLRTVFSVLQNKQLYLAFPLS
jgi:hypothetical protein